MSIIEYNGKLNDHKEYNNYILFTITHEGDIAINDEII